MTEPKKFYSTVLRTCRECRKPAGIAIKSGGETYDFACSETHAKRIVADLTRAWASS